jgi:putative oxidoreductase
MAGLGLVVLRLALAVVFVAHGGNQLFGLWSGPGIGPGGLQNTAAQYAAMGLHPEFLLAVLAGVTQLAGGLLIGVGVLTRWASAALVVYLLIGVWKEHLRWGFYLNWLDLPGRGHGIEYSLVLAGALVCLMLGGGGDWSVDGRRAHSRDRLAAGRARLRGKL